LPERTLSKHTLSKKLDARKDCPVKIGCDVSLPPGLQSLLSLGIPVCYNLKTGKMSEMLTRLNGKAIRIPGFMVPLDDMEYESVGRFLLVPDPQACIHVPPPPANQMIYVVMKGKKKAPVSWGMPVVLTGDLKVKSIRSQFGVVSFQIAGESVKPYTGK
jgi:uncharacterized protein